jgi:hypothetical protein
MPLYTVTDKATGRSLLVEADRPASALRVVTDAIYAISTPTPLEAAILAAEGARILRVGKFEIDPNGRITIEAVPTGRPPKAANDWDEVL